MVVKSKVLLWTNDIRTEQAVIALFETGLGDGDQKGFDLSGVFHDAGALAARLDAGPCPAVLVDIEAEPLETLEALEPLANRYVLTRFIALAGQLSGELAIKAMQVGVRHIQLKETMTGELAGVLGRLVSNVAAQASPVVPASSRQGAVLTVLSAGGGCGATTLVVNLGNELRLATSHPVLLVDLDFCYGAIATYLGLQGKYGISEVLDHQGEIDSQLVHSTAVPYAGEFGALLSPASIGPLNGATIRVEKLAPVLAASKQTYAFTLVDAPRVPMDTAAILGRESDGVLVVLQPSVKDVRAAKAIVSGLIDRGIGRHRIRPIVNRWRSRYQTLTMNEIRDALGGIVPRPLSNDYSWALSGAEYGKPLAEIKPRATLRRELAEMAARLGKWDSATEGITDIL